MINTHITDLHTPVSSKYKNSSDKGNNSNTNNINNNSKS